MHDAITDVEVLEAGHYTDTASATGCTVVLCRQGAVGGVDVRGGAPGTRETDLLRPGNLVERVHVVLLTGGSVFGLGAATGVVRFLEEQEVGFQMGEVRVPIVSAAVLFDLGLVTGKVRPGPEEGYEACLNVSTGPLEEGSVGAGTGATVAKALGMGCALKGGIGTASYDLGQGIVVGALVAVNAYGGVVDHVTGRRIAGPRSRDGTGLHDTVELLLKEGPLLHPDPLSSNTTIGVVATNARLTKEEANFLACQAQDGLALTIRPSHTIRDGDTIFAMATGTAGGPCDRNRLGAAAVEVVAQAVRRAVGKARGLGDVPGVAELVHE